MPDEIQSSPASLSGSRVWLRRLLLGAGALAVLYLLTAFALSRFLDPEALADWLEPRLEDALSRDVEVGSVKVGVFPLEVELHDLTVADPTGLAPELARVTSLDLRVAILPLLQREVQVSRLNLDGLQANLRVSGDGRSNFGDLSNRPTAPPDSSSREGGDERAARSDDSAGEGAGVQRTAAEEAGDRRPFTLDLRGLRVSGGQVSFTDAGRPLEARIAELQLQATARRDSEAGWSLAGSAAGDVTLREGDAGHVLDGTPLEMDFDLEIGEDFQELRIRKGELLVGPVSLAVGGSMDHLLDPVRTLALELTGRDIPVPELLAALPDSIRQRIPMEAEGAVDIGLTVEGRAGPGHLPSVSGEVALARGRVQLDGETVADNLTADIRLLLDRSIRASTRGTLLGGPFSAEGAAMTGESGTVDLTFRAAPDLALIPAVVDLPEGVTVLGQVASEIRVVGPPTDPAGLRFRGTIEATGLQATHPALGVPLGVPRGTLELNGIRAIVRDLPLELGADHLVLSGELADLLAFLGEGELPRFEGSLQGSRLDITKLSTRPRPDSTLTFGKVAFAKVGGRRVGDRDVAAAAEELGLRRPVSLPMAGRLELALDTLIDTQGRMEGVRASLEFGPDFVRIPQAAFRRYGGEVTTSADIDLTPQGTAPFSFNLQVRDLDAADFISQTTPLGSFARGTLSLDLDVIGSLDEFLLPERQTLVGSATFSLTGGGLAAVPVTRALSDFLGLESLRDPSIQDWSGSLLLQEGRVRISESRLEGAPGSPTVGGSVGLNGDLDLRSIFDLPVQRLDAGALERLGVAGEIAARVAQRPEVVRAVLRIGGSVFDPLVEADPASAARTIGQALEEEVRTEGETQVEAQRAEAQRRIEEQKEELRNRASGFLRGLLQPRDTVPSPPPPDTTGPDTTRPDTVTPDATRPDTTRPDTVTPDTTGPDTTRPNTVTPDTTRPDTTRPDTTAAPGLTPSHTPKNQGISPEPPGDPGPGSRPPRTWRRRGP